MTRRRRLLLLPTPMTTTTTKATTVAAAAANADDEEDDGGDTATTAGVGDNCCCCCYRRRRKLLPTPPTRTKATTAAFLAFSATSMYFITFHYIIYLINKTGHHPGHGCGFPCLSCLHFYLTLNSPADPCYFILSIEASFLGTLSHYWRRWCNIL